jgi:hypothetical protein
MTVSHSMLFSPRIVKFCILTLIAALVAVSAEEVETVDQFLTHDQHEACDTWADVGECEKNSSFMLEACATSCDRVLKAANALEKERKLQRVDFPEEGADETEDTKKDEDTKETEETKDAKEDEDTKKDEDVNLSAGDSPDAAEEDDDEGIEGNPTTNDNTPPLDIPQDTVADPAPEAAVEEEEEPVFTLPFHQDASVVPLTDAIFEHATQASTGQTTGSWLVVFYEEDLMATGPAIPAYHWLEHHIVLGAVEAVDAPETIARFEIEKLPAILFLHEKKVYTYPEESLIAGAAVTWKDLAAFCENTATVAAWDQSRDIPPPPTFWSRLEIQLDAMGLSTTMVMAGQVAVVVLGLWLTALVGAARKSTDSKKVR